MDKKRRVFLQANGVALGAMALPMGAFAKIPRCQTLTKTVQQWTGKADINGLTIEHCTGSYIFKKSCQHDMKMFGLSKGAHINMFANDSLPALIARNNPLNFILALAPNGSKFKYALTLRDPFIIGLTFENNSFQILRTDKNNQAIIAANGNPIGPDEMTFGIYAKAKETFYAEYKMLSDRVKAGLSEQDLEKILDADLAKIFITYHNKVVYTRAYNTSGLRTLLHTLQQHVASVKQQAKRQECESCFLTTSACGAMQRADDCWELEALRSFRDNYLLRIPGGRADIARYYRIAPHIITAIQQRNSSGRVFRSLYWYRIIPFALMTKLGLKRTVHYLYKKWVYNLERRYIQ